MSSRGGKIKTVVDIFSVIAEGNESQNIRLFDGDVVIVARSPVELRDQVIKASQTNLSPDFISVFVSGRVRNPGLQELPQGASLDQAIANAEVKGFFVDKSNSSVSTAAAPISENFS